MPPSNNHEKWETCPPGELQRLVSKLDVIAQHAKRKKMAFYGAGATLVATCSLVVAVTLLSSSPIHHGGLTCQQCQSHLAKYHEQIDTAPKHAFGDTMNAELTKSMEVHLANCKRCRELFQAKYSGRLAFGQTIDQFDSTGRFISMNHQLLAQHDSPLNSTH